MADPNTPSWLSEPAAGAPAPAAASDSAPSTSEGLQTVEVDAPAAATTESSAAADDGADLPGIILIMRLANMGAAIALMTASILLMTSIPPISTFVLAVYATCGGLLICCLETQLKFLRVMIAINFGFLFNGIARFMFYLLLASVAWSFRNLFGRIVAIAFIVVAFFNTYVLFRYPSYRKMREKIAEEEDKRIEARIGKEVKKQALQRAGLGGNNI